MRIGAHTARYTDPTDSRYKHDWDIEPAVLEAIPNPERKVGDKAGDGRSSTRR